MSLPLKLSLKPGEAVIVNGAVLRNGERRGTLLLANRSRVLREKDILRPDDAVSASERAYFAIMQMYLTDEIDGPLYDQAASALSAALSSVESDEMRAMILSISKACAAGETYKAISECRKLMKHVRAATGEADA
ncbi:MAG: flagellar biosynthesis repressor FlbT [Pseudomonadota bacterium]